jgi:folate-dependent phosphoribosylglycinamide formyltransferase PurN
MPRLLVVSDDKLGRRLAARVADVPGLLIAADATPSAGRIVRLLRRGSLSPLLLVRMAVAETVRRDTQAKIQHRICGNSELHEFIRARAIQDVYLFRAGLIIGRDLLNSGARFFNCHCARLDGFAGLGAIHRALREGAHEQAATLHRVTQKIDNGEIIALEPYRLDPGKAYRANEDIAYDAGIRLLSRMLRQPEAA